MKLIHKLTFYLIFPLLLLITIFGYSIYKYNASILKTQLVNKSIITSIHATKLISDRVNFLKSQLIELSLIEHLNQYFMYKKMGNSDVLEDIRANFEDAVLAKSKLYPDLFSIEVIESNDGEIAKVEEQKISYKYSEFKNSFWIKNTLELEKNQFLLYDFYHEQSNKYFLSISTCFYLSDHKTALLRITVDSKQFINNILENLNINDLDNIVLLNNTGVIIGGIFNNNNIIISNLLNELVISERNPTSTVKLNNKNYLTTTNKLNINQYYLIYIQPLEKALHIINNFRNFSIIVTLLLGLFLFIFLYYFNNQLIVNPINKITLFINELSRGKFDINIPVISDDEIGSLGIKINEMAQELKQTTVSIDNLRSEINQRLEVQRRLEITNKNLINNETALQNMLQDLQNMNTELKSTQGRMVQSEKMASIGQLSAGIAHEMNNPIGFIGSNLQILETYANNIFKLIDYQEDFLQNYKKYLHENRASDQLSNINEFRTKMKYDFIKIDLKNLISESLSGIDRIKIIIDELKNFSRENPEEKFENANVEIIIEGILKIISNELKYKAKLIKNYGRVPMIKCSPQKLGQVFINILVNAAQSIKDFGEIEISTFTKGEIVGISIKDNGSGIPEETVTKIFDPFYTTKPVGKGTGLGLSISYDIIKKHGGEIFVNSIVDVGTTFTIYLPALMTT